MARFSRSSASTYPQRPRRGFVPSVEEAERRVVLSTLPHHVAIAALPVHYGISAKVTLNQKVVDFLNANVGKRIGGGECAHVASEALRVAGAKFLNGNPSANPNATGTDSPSAGDYDWGTLIKVVQVSGGKVVDSNPTAKIIPGDILQYRNTVFKVGNTTFTASHHTAVVAAVDALGRVTKVFQQNISTAPGAAASRTLSVGNLDLLTMTAGWVRVYRPEARSTVNGLTEFSVVNNAASNQSIRIGSSNFTLTSANTTASYGSFWWKSSVAPTLTLGTKTYTLANGAGYQITGSGSSLTLSRLPA